MQVNIMKELRSSNVVLFMGVCLQPLRIITEYCSHGSLYDVIKEAREGGGSVARRMTWARRLKMARDAAAVRFCSAGFAVLVRVVVPGWAASATSHQSPNHHPPITQSPPTL